MRLNYLYNFLRSGRLFFYRDIFSGLSNETIGAALYAFTPYRSSLPVIQSGKACRQPFTSLRVKSNKMDKSTSTMLAFIIKYDGPLQRYARFLVKDPIIASALVKEIFELVYDENGFDKTETELRQQLKDYTLKACNYWLHMQALHNCSKN